MIILWTISVVIILFLAAGAVFLWLQVKKLKYLEHILSEAFWQRRNKIPLLIELARKAGIKDIPFDEILDLSSRFSAEAENKLFNILSGIFRASEQNISLLALKKEFEADSSQIKIALNDYDFEKARFSGLFSKYLKLKTFNKAE